MGAHLRGPVPQGAPLARLLAEAVRRHPGGADPEGGGPLDLHGKGQVASRARWPFGLSAEFPTAAGPTGGGHGNCEYLLRAWSAQSLARWERADRGARRQCEQPAAASRDLPWIRWPCDA